jgi:hypothetical protein
MMRRLLHGTRRTMAGPELMRIALVVVAATSVGAGNAWTDTWKPLGRMVRTKPCRDIRSERVQ